MTIQTALQQGAALLSEAGVLAPKLTAEVLLGHALQRERTYLYTYPERELSELAWIHYGRYLHERMQGRPTQYITKRQEFYGREFRLTSAVLIPRPETEHLVECCLTLPLDRRVVVDLGAGSGAIAVTLALESSAQVCAVDLSAAALAVAQDNARRLGADVRWIQGDFTTMLAPQSCDVLVSNPPYIAHGARPTMQREVRDFEPGLALFAGPSGTEAYARILEDAPRVLHRGGWLLLELGHDSLEPVQSMLGSVWQDVRVTPDLAGIPRVLQARYAP